MPEHLPALIHDAATRSDDDTVALIGALSRSCWPGGADRHSPVASKWLRRWTPASMPVAAAGCGCAAGRCSVCN